MNLIHKFEKYLFYVFIFTFPFQTRLVLARWAPLPDIQFNEWTSAFLYGSDILILACLALWSVRIFGKKDKIVFNKSDIFLVGFFLVSAFSIFQSRFLVISPYQLVKLAEFIVFYLYVRNNLTKIFRIDIGLKIFVLSGFFQSIVAIAQSIKQAGLGLRWLGESPIHLGVEGIASFYVKGQLYLRSYGTLPHPNILACFLFLALVSLAVLYVGKKIKHPAWLVGYGVMIFAFFLTYSRTVIAIGVLPVLIIFLAGLINKNLRAQLLQSRKQLITLGAIAIGVAIVFVGLNYDKVIARVFFSTDKEAISLRLFYARVAGEGIISKTWLGYGIGTFVPDLMLQLKHVPAYIFQPVHNIYLLILSETGLLGLLFWGWFIRLKMRDYITKHSFAELFAWVMPIVMISLLLMGIFDHFLWTIQQGRIMLWLALALLW